MTTIKAKSVFESVTWNLHAEQMSKEIIASRESNELTKNDSSTHTDEHNELTHKNTKVINIINAKWDFWFWIWILPLSFIPLLLRLLFPNWLAGARMCLYFGLMCICYTRVMCSRRCHKGNCACIVRHLIIARKYDINKYIHHICSNVVYLNASSTYTDCHIAIIYSHHLANTIRIFAAQAKFVM